MKKYKLQDLVENGSYARRKIDSDLLVGDVTEGYGYGDILDANATSKLIKERSSDEETKAKIRELEQGHLEQAEQIEAVEESIQTVRESAVKAQVDGSNLIISSL